MRNALAALVLLLSTGCPDEGGGGRNEPRDPQPGATVSSGQYKVSHFDNYGDGCELNFSAGDFNGGFVPIIVIGSDVDVNGISITIDPDGTFFGGETQQDADLLGGGTCTGDVTQALSGTIPANDEIDVVESITIETAVGACDEVPVDIPCTTEYFVRLKRE